MSDKSDEESVLGSLPATRPTRFGRERRQSGGGTATKTAPKARSANARQKTGAAKESTAKATTARRKAAKGSTAKAAPRAAGADAPPEPKPAKRPRPVRAGAPSLRESTERARTAEPPPQTRTTPPSGTELVTTAIQAAGELAQIGLAVGGQVLRRAVEKLPKP